LLTKTRPSTSARSTTRRAASRARVPEEHGPLGRRRLGPLDFDAQRSRRRRGGEEGGDDDHRGQGALLLEDAHGDVQQQQEGEAEAEDPRHAAAHDPVGAGGEREDDRDDQERRPLALVDGATDAVAGYELVARAIGALSMAALLYLLLVRLRAVPDLSGKSDVHERTGIFLTATSLGFGVGMLYEVGAWASNGLFDTSPYTFDELIAHMAIYLVASAAGAALLVIWDRAGWSTRRAPAAALAGQHA
jgi:hypothetical protein